PPRAGSVRRQDRHHRGLRGSAGDVYLAAGIDEHIDLAADAELRQVDPWLDGEAGARQDAALLVGLQVVHVGAVAVDLLTDRVAGAVAEVFAVAGRLDHRPGRLIHLPALERFARGERRSHPLDGRIASPGDQVEDARVLVRDAVPHKPG